VVRDRTQDDSFREAAVEGGNLVVTTSSGRRHVLPVMEVRHAACRRCPVRNPRFADYLVGDPVSQEEASGFSGGEMERLSAAGTEERWAAFRREMGKCILCMACRNLCPACYCADCFAESTQPRWLTRGSDESDAMFFHLSRLTHLAGRCTGCGACARGCPVGVRLEVYYDRLRKDVKEVFGFEAGLDPRAEPPLTCFRQDDENAFIM
jgi:ferredoxin